MGINNKADYRDNEMKQRYIEAYLQFKAGVLTIRDFSEKTIEILLMWIDLYETVHPYYENMKQLAEDYYQKSIKAYGRPAVNQQQQQRLSSPYVDELKRQYTLFYCQYKQGALSRFKFNQVLVHTLFKLLQICDALEPYFGEFEKEAENFYQASLNSQAPVKPSITNNPKINSAGKIDESLFLAIPGRQNKIK